MTGKPGESTPFLIKLKKVLNAAASTTYANPAWAVLRNCLMFNNLVA